MRRSRKGITRIVEALIACIILIIGVYSVTYFSNVSAAKEDLDLEEIGKNALTVISSSTSVEGIVKAESGWESKIKNLVGALLPEGVSYSLTLSNELTGQTIATVTNTDESGLSSFENKISVYQIVTISYPTERVEQKNLDVILAVDISESMGDRQSGDEYTKLHFAKQAMNLFLDNLDPIKDRAGLISFSGDTDASSGDDAFLNSPLTNDTAEVSLLVNSLTVLSRRNMGEAFVKAKEEFDANGNDQSTKAVVFLTDGWPNEPHFTESLDVHSTHTGLVPCPVAQEYARNESKELSELGVVVYTIGIGSRTSLFDQQLLKEIQSGRYYYSPQGEDLLDIYMSILKDLLYGVKYEIIRIELSLVKGA